ncbi:MAG: imidazole glycerol phosphate synthase subunit HisH [Clostridiales bacterium]|nr:imidazole glycerol phosphate synthase subunit HisH [Clostridiales bacterium]
MSNQPEVSIIDYGAGNLHSVRKAFEYIGLTAEIVTDPDALAGARRVVLPGVGAFGDAMRSLIQNGMDQAVLSAIGSGKPFLGICLGFQLMFESGEEFAEDGVLPGLGVFPGRVTRLPESVVVPHMGWNGVAAADPVIFGEEREMYVYFVHSFCCPLSDSLAPHVSAVCDYGVRFAAAARRGVCLGTQFHPEKSGAAGLKILERFGGLPIC